jgi:hypothetical protein
LKKDTSGEDGSAADIEKAAPGESFAKGGTIAEDTAAEDGIVVVGDTAAEEIQQLGKTQQLKKLKKTQQRAES